MSNWTEFVAEHERVEQKIRIAESRKLAQNSIAEYRACRQRKLWTRVLVVAFLLILAAVVLL